MKTITDTVQQRHLLELQYHGYSRTVEPHVDGRDKSGDEVLRCYQNSGGSESGERFGWKLLKVAEVFFIHQLKESFPQRPEYKRNDKAKDYIFSQL